MRTVYQTEITQATLKLIRTVAKRDDNQEYIYTPYITIKGVRVYKKGGGVFRIPVGKKKS